MKVKIVSGPVVALTKLIWGMRYRRGIKVQQNKGVKQCFSWVPFHSIFLSTV